MTARTVKRVAPSRRFDRALFLELIGLPWSRMNIGAAKRGRPPKATPAAEASPAEAQQAAQEGAAQFGAEAGGAVAEGSGVVPEGGGDPPIDLPSAPVVAQEFLLMTPGADRIAKRPAEDSPGALLAETYAAASTDGAQLVVQPAEGEFKRGPPLLEFSPSAAQPAVKARVGGIAAEHCDDVRPSFLEHLASLQVADPAAASDEQLLRAGRLRALDGLKG